MESFLSHYEHIDLHSCESAEDGLALLETMKPDLILMDINLPGMSGIQLSQIMQENAAWRAIPIIALTATARQKNTDITEGLFKAYITKPIDFSLLPNILHTYL